MNKEREFMLKEKGDKFDFKLDLDAGEFHIYQNGQLISSCRGLKNQTFFPNIDIMYPDTTVTLSNNFITRKSKKVCFKSNFWTFGYQMQEKQLKIIEATKTKKIGNKEWFRVFGSRLMEYG